MYIYIYIQYECVKNAANATQNRQNKIPEKMQNN